MVRTLLLLLSQLSSAHAFSLAARSVGLYVPCITVRCDRGLEDLSLWPSSGILGLVACVLLTSATLRVCGRRSSSATWRKLAAVASALLAMAALMLPVLLFVHLQRARTLAAEAAASHEHAAQRTHLHSCWDRCLTGNFSIYVHGAREAAKEKTPPLWSQPPSHVVVAASPEEACVVVVPKLLAQAGKTSLEWVAQLPGWRQGRNHIFVDQSDEGTTLQSRRKWLGCAAIGQSHMELTNFVPGFDISLPLDGSRMGLGALNQLAATYAHTPSAVRPFFLTFRGTTYQNPEEAGAGRTRLLDLVHLNTPAKRIVVAVQCHKIHGEHKLPAYSDRCSAYDEAMRLVPAYTTLLNTTFALVPGGRQPASFRLNEVIAVGAIPVFISGDKDTTRPYVLPFDGILDWGKFSFHFSWDTPAREIVTALLRVDGKQLSIMQKHVRHAWNDCLRPTQSSKQFYYLLERRARRGVRR